jgi:RNA polymerase sigma factor (sigma-70 family)
MRVFCTKHTKEDNNALYPQVAAGDKEARQAMIRNNMPLVVTIVDDFLTLHPDFGYLRDDFTSAGFLGLSRAIQKMSRAGFHVKKITPFMARAIQHDIITEVQRANKHSCCQSSEVDLTRRSLSHRIDSIERIETQELIESVCETDLDKQLLALRHEGYTIREMAIVTGMTRMTVTRAFHAIKKRYLEISK